jgi:hypothetical protein
METFPAAFSTTAFGLATTESINRSPLGAAVYGESMTIAARVVVRTTPKNAARKMDLEVVFITISRSYLG